MKLAQSFPKRAKAGTDPRRLTRFLADLGGEMIVQDGEAVTRDEALAQTLWNMALGSEYKNEDGKACFRLPDKSVAIFIVERREGRMPMTSQMEDSTGMSAADKVDELAKERINAAADSILAVPEPGTDVDMPEDGD